MLDIAKSFGKRLQRIRKSKRVTQEQLAEKVGLDTMTISRIENGKEYPKPDNFAKICEVLHTSPKNFYDFNLHETKQDIINELTHIIHNATFRDLQFYKKVINSYIENK